MQIIRMIVASTLIIFSISCAKISIKPHTNKLYDYSGEFKSCYEYDIIFSKKHVGRVGDGKEVDLSNCKNLLGFKVYDENGNDFPSFKAWVEIDVFEAVSDGTSTIDMNFDRTR